MKNIIEQFLFLVKDIKRWKVNTLKGIFYLFFEQGIWVTILYRFRRMLFCVKIPVIKIIFSIINLLIFKFTEIVLGTSISAETDIGPGLYIGHTGGIVIHPKVKIGKNLNIGQGITVGERGPGHGAAVPIIGDNVYIGIGAKVFGDIKIGNDVKIGANAVVLCDVPDNATAVGIPAKIIKSNNSKMNIK